VGFVLREGNFSIYFNVYLFILTKHSVCVFSWKVAMYVRLNILK
jgi:hypothetical protein